jgi:hypothetical protein
MRGGESSSRRPEMVTTSCVIADLVAYFVSRGRHAKAVDLAENLQASSGVRLFDAHFEQAGFTRLPSPTR